MDLLCSIFSFSFSLSLLLFIIICKSFLFAVATHIMVERMYLYLLYRLRVTGCILNLPFVYRHAQWNKLHYTHCSSVSSWVTENFLAFCFNPTPLTETHLLTEILSQFRGFTVLSMYELQVNHYCLSDSAAMLAPILWRDYSLWQTKFIIANHFSLQKCRIHDFMVPLTNYFFHSFVGSFSLSNITQFPAIPGVSAIRYTNFSPWTVPSCNSFNPCSTPASPPGTIRTLFGLREPSSTHLADLL